MQRIFAILSIMPLIAFPAKSYAQTTPALRQITAPLVSPSAGWGFYGGSTTHTNGVAAWSSYPPEIQALARSMGANRLTNTQFTQNVFDYIRNNIAVEFRFGLGKGGRGALIDQSGTPFDQAELMVKTLRAGGLAASYQVGTITLSAQQFGQWSGLVTNINQSTQTFNLSIPAVCQFLADGGIPATLTVSGASQSSCVGLAGAFGAGDHITLSHIWVLANGNLYDPSFKQNTLKAGVDLPSAMGCGSASAPTCASRASTSNLQGSSSGNFITGVPYLQNLNESALFSTMSAFSMSLENSIIGLNRSSSISDVIGGAVPDTTYSPVVGASLTYTSSLFASWTGDIPDQYRTVFKLQDCSASVAKKVLYADEISGRRVRYFITNSTGAVGNGGISLSYSTYLDDASLGACTPGVGVNPALIINVTHPYAANTGAYGQDSMTLPYENLGYGPFTFVMQVGEASQSTSDYYTSIQAADPTPFANAPYNSTYTVGASGTYCGDTNSLFLNACRGDADPVTAADILSQTSNIYRLSGNITGIKLINHHRIGFAQVGQWSNSPHGVTTYHAAQNISISSAISADAASGAVAPSQSAIEFAAHLSSVIEGSVPQQSSNGIEPFSGALDLVYSNRGGSQILDVPASSMSAVTPLLKNYITASIQALATAGFESIIPQDGIPECPTSGSYTTSTGCSVFTHRYGSDYEIQSGATALMLGEVLKGATEGQPDPTADALKPVQSAMNRQKSERARLAVNGATGGFSVSPPADITTGDGEFPRSLGFQRLYQSDALITERPSKAVVYDASYGNGPASTYTGIDADSWSHLEGGWTHNFQVTAKISNNAWIAMGQDAAIEGSGLIAGIVTLNGLMTTPTFQSRVSASFVDYWIARQIFNNVVSVTQGISTNSFRLLPDGTYNPPPGSADVLAVIGSKTSAPHGGPTPDYDYRNVSMKLTDRAGAITSFSWSRNWYPYGWAPPGDTTYTQNLPFVPPEFKADQIAFPSGIVVKYNYSYDQPSTNLLANDVVTPGHDQYYLNGVSNSLGRALNFNLVAAGSDPNFISFIISGVFDENGRSVSYQRSNCPVMIKDQGGQYASRPYTYLCNNLSVTYPNLTVENFSYAAGADSPDPTVLTRPNYRLRRWYEPANTSTAYETILYDNLYRVAMSTDILGHQTSYFPSAADTNEIWKRSDEVDSLGNMTTSWFDQWNDILQSSDPLGRTTTYAYDQAHRKILSDTPLLSCSASTFDIRNNLLIMKLYPAGSCNVTGQSVSLNSSPATPIVTSSVFEEAATVYPCANLVTCNEPASTTDGRGNVTNYTWDPASGLLTQILKPGDQLGAQPEADLAYSNVTGSDGATLKLLSQKTEYLMKSQSSSQTSVTKYDYDSNNHYALTAATVDSGGLNLRTCFKFDVIGNLVSVSDPRAASCP